MSSPATATQTSQTTQTRHERPGAGTRRPSRRPPVPAPPLGSLTQGGADGRGTGEPCGSCASTAVTNLTMTLSDGTPASFTSCRTCGQRRWTGSGQHLSISEVLARATRS